MTPEKLVSDYESFKVSKCSSSARASATRISEIGHPCTAYLAFTRVAGEQREMPDPVLACIFDEGHNQERAVMQDLQAMGYTCTESQRSLYWDSFEISGHPDCKLSKDGWSVPLEIKSVAPWNWVKMNCEADIREHKSYFYSKWAAQVHLYMLLESCEEYWVILKNKSTGQLKAIAFHLDLAFADQFLKKAEEVKRGVGAFKDIDTNLRQSLAWNEWLTSHRLNDPDICNECPFKSTCLPELDAGEGAMSYQDPEFQEMISRHEEIKPLATEYDHLHEEITDNCKVMFNQGHTEIVCGDWHIMGKEGKFTFYDVPKDIKDKYKSFGAKWTTKINRVGSTGK